MVDDFDFLFMLICFTKFAHEPTIITYVFRKKYFKKKTSLEQGNVREKILFLREECVGWKFNPMGMISRGLSGGPVIGKG